jgi:hypothetical protein
MTQSQERLEILEMIQKGTITSEEGLKLIEALAESQEAADQEYHEAKEEMEGMFARDEDFTSPDSAVDMEFEKWKSWWIIPFWIGVAITVLGGGLMYLAWFNNGIGLGFIAAWIPFLLGIGLLVLGWNSRTGPWLHLRIRQEPGEKPEQIAISFPIPVHFFAWSLRTFGSFVKNVDLSGADQVLLALGDYSQGDAPLSIDVDEGENGEKVEIYIG